MEILHGPTFLDRRDSNIEVAGLSSKQKRVSLSSVSEVQDFFLENELPYTLTNSRDQNILDNINRLPIDCDCIYVFENISFLVPDGNIYKFPFNYRFKNCEVIGGSRLEFSDDLEPDGPIAVDDENDLKSLLGVYYPEKSIVWNIREAERSGIWPSTIDVNLNEIPLNVDTAEPITLPKNAILHNCWIETGHLIFETGVLNVVSENAIGEAGGLGSKVRTSVGRAYSNLGHAHADGTGIAVALYDESYARASGAGSKVIGRSHGSIISAKDGATAVKHVDTVKATKDTHPDSKILMSAPQRNAPPPYRSFENGKVYIETERARNYKEYLVELKILADLGDEKSACILLAVDKNKFQACMPAIKYEEFYLYLIELGGSGEQADQACKGYIDRYKLTDVILGRQEKYYQQPVPDRYSDESPNEIHICFWKMKHDVLEDRNVPKSHPYVAQLFRFSGNRSDRETAKKFFNIAQEKGFIKKSEYFGEYERKYIRSKNPDEDRLGVSMDMDEDPGCIIS